MLNVMGDMADFTIEQMENDELYFSGAMYDDATNSFVGHGHRKPLYCKFCNKGPLEWKLTSKRWIMCESDGNIHDCPVNPPSIEIHKEYLKNMKQNKTNEELLSINRLTVDEYGCMLTLAGKSRAEDYFTHCGAVALNKNKRVLGVAYNGLKAGYDIPSWMKLPENRIRKNDYMLHAENNLFAMVKKDECDVLYLNISPCHPCCRIIAANNVRKVVFIKEYHRCNKYIEFLGFYGIEYMELPKKSKENIKEYLLNKSNFEELE